MHKGKLFVERRSEGDYAVRNPGSQSASAAIPTQAKAAHRSSAIESGRCHLRVFVQRQSGNRINGAQALI